MPLIFPTDCFLRSVVVSLRYLESGVRVSAVAQDAEHCNEGLCSEGLCSNPKVWCVETDYNGGCGSRTWSWLQGRHGVFYCLIYTVGIHKTKSPGQWVACTKKKCHFTMRLGSFRYSVFQMLSSSIHSHLAPPLQGECPCHIGTTLTKSK